MASNVAVRFVEPATPALVRENETETVSPASTVALAGEKLSESRVARAARMSGKGLTTVVITVEELLAALVSADVVASRAILVSWPCELGTRVKLMMAQLDGAIVPSVATRLEPCVATEPWLLLDATRDAPAG